MKKHWLQIVKNTSLGTAIGVLISAIVLFIMSGVLSVVQISPIVIAPMAFAAQIIGGFAGGFFSGLLSKEKGFLCGFLSGILFFLIIWLFGCLWESGEPGIEAVFKIVILSTAGIIGGILGVNQ